MRISDWSSDVCSSDLLAVENDEAEQQRVIEYLALSNWASQAAYGAVMANKKAASLRLPLQRLMAALKTQTEAILSLVEADRTYFDELSVQLDERLSAVLVWLKQSAPSAITRCAAVSGRRSRRPHSFHKQ